MPLFLSTYSNKIDKKGRVSLPASFRSALAETGSEDPVAFPSFVNASIEGWSQERMQKLVDRIDAFDPFSEEHDDFAMSVPSESRHLKLDGEGRIMLPEPFLIHTGITDLVAFVGRGNTFQIWQPEKYAAHSIEAKSRARERRGELRWQDKGQD